MKYVRYGEEGKLLIGPVIKSTDGYSKLTGMTSAELQFVYYVGTGPTSGSYATGGSSGMTEIGSGLYSCYFSTLMSGQLGPGYIQYQIGGSSGIPFRDEYTVLAQHTYDALIKGTGTDVLQVDIAQINGATGTMATGVIDVNVEQLAGTTLGDNVSSGYMRVDAAYPTTGSNMNVGAVAGSTLTDINDFVTSGYTIGTGDRTLGDLYTGMSAWIWGNSTYDGSTVAYYTSDGGTELWSAELTTAKRTVTTN